MAGERIPRIERLLNLTAMLLDTPRALTVEEIGSKMQGYPDNPASFRRQFERDKDELRAAGVPLEVAPLDATDLSEFGYRIPPERYYLPDPGFTEDETSAIRVAIASISLDGDAGTEALRKFGIDGDAEPTPIANVAAPAEVATLRAAIADTRTVSFSFRDEPREVEPHRLTYLNGQWYLTGFDRRRQGVRNFRIDRIDGELTLGPAGSFTPPAVIEGLQVEPWRFGDDDPTEVTMRVDADHLAVVRLRFGRDAVWQEHDDGSADVTFVVRGRAAFRSFALSMLDHAVIVSPSEVRDWFVESLGAGVR